MFEIRGKVALVAGGASGIGLTTIKQLLDIGLKGVTIVDVNEELGRIVVENLNKQYGDEKVLFVKANVADRSDFEGAFQKTVAAFKYLDVVINSAGIVKDLAWEEEVAINLCGTMTGTYFAIEKYLPRYKSGSEGVIINLASLAGIDVCSFLHFYSATKAGVVHLTRAYGIPAHYNRNHVRVMAVCPGLTDTPILKLHPEKHLSQAYIDIRMEEHRGAICQSVEHVANSIVRIIKEGRNGSIWIVNDNEPAYEVKCSTSKDRLL